MSVLSSNTLWQNYYNSNDAWFPFWIPFSFWLSCFFYCKRYKYDYARWYKLHVLHHVGAIVQGSISLYYSNDEIFNERITILWSAAYFAIDIIDCVIFTQHLTYAWHAAICLFLGYCNYATPLFRSTLRMNSKAAFIETSSIILYKVRETRNPILFSIFTLLYTLCRIIWIPILMKQLYSHGIKWHDKTMIMLMGFYGLNLFWYSKILRILINGGEKGTVRDESKRKSA